MRDVDNETTRTYALRLRASGELLRVEHRADIYGDAESPYAQTEYTLSTDGDYPVYTAGSPEELALAFSREHPGSGRDSPHLGGYKPADVEAVEIEETVTRRVRPTGMPFDLAVPVDGRYIIDIHPSFAKQIDGLGPVIEAFESHRGDVEAVRYPGSAQAWGRCYLVGKVVAGPPDSLPDGWANALIRDKDSGSSQPRRAIAALPLPEELLHLTGRWGTKAAAATLVICFGDTRRVPESLSEAIADLAPQASPAP